ncbi:MAG: VanW family protein [Eubacteriaceae bacterium]|nr:VanW family protein [Eubacteriaceae bacterium]
MSKRTRLFCEISPACYAISVLKETFKRHIKDLLSKEKIAATIGTEELPNIVFAHNSNMIKRAKGVDLTLQENKAVNIKLACSKLNRIIVRPGEVFSFWKTVGKDTKKKGYKEGRVMRKDGLVPGIGGGLCNLANTIHLLVLHSPLEVFEFHSHSDALAPDEGMRVPFSAGTSVSYNYIDYRFKNTTDQDIQLLLWCEGEILCAELRSERAFPWSYRLVEENHHFKREEDKYYRISKIYKEISETATANVLDQELVLDNHSEVLYDYALIPQDQIRDD